MRFKYNKINAFFVLFVFAIQTQIQADEAYVYCANEKLMGNWLANKTIKVSGEWKVKQTGLILSKIYFIPDRGAQEILSLTFQCIKEVGNGFIYALPVNIFSETWHTFGLNDNLILLAPWENPKYTLEFLTHM